MLDSLIGEMMGHWCNGRVIVSADDPRNRKFGWACMGCDTYWEIGIDVCRNDTSCYKDLLMTPEGRRRLQEIINHGGWCLMVWDEEELPI